MANFKKEDKASIIARLNELEAKVEVLEREMAKPMETTVMSVIPGIPITSTAVNPVSPVATTPVVPIHAVPEIKRKCQTDTCNSMETKEYQGKDRKMWLCDSHKL